jgi:hypothetical protein
LAFSIRRQRLNTVIQKTLDGSQQHRTRPCLREYLLKSMRKPALLAPALLGVSLSGAAQAQVISNTRTSTYVMTDPTLPVSITSTGSINVISGAALTTDTIHSGWQIINHGLINSQDMAANIGYGIDLKTVGSVTNYGSINGQGAAGIRVRNGGTITSEATGSITSDGDAIFSDANVTVVNHGYMGVGGMAVWAKSGTATIRNDGAMISGAIAVWGDGAALDIENSGTMQGNTNAVLMDSGGTIVNNGTLASVGPGTVAVTVGAGGGTIVNYGTIVSGAGGTAVRFGSGGRDAGAGNGLRLGRRRQRRRQCRPGPGRHGQHVEHGHQLQHLDDEGHGLDAGRQCRSGEFASAERHTAPDRHLEHHQHAGEQRRDPGGHRHPPGQHHGEQRRDRRSRRPSIRRRATIRASRPSPS